MRLIAFRPAGEPMMGAVEGDMVRPLCGIDEFYDDVDAGMAASGGEPVAIDDVTQVPPVPTTSRIFCIGLNYPLHIAETKSTRPDFPNLFARWYAALDVDGGSTPVPPGEAGLDWEAELAVIIGREMLAVDRADAMAAIIANHRVAVFLGVLLNDVANISQAGSWLNQLDTFIEALLGNLDQALCARFRLADDPHLTGITVVAILYYGDINIKDVSVLEYFLL